jgi:hypothetical protein
MPLQNRVTPFGEIVSYQARGLFMGNRGILHDDHRCLGKARWRHPHWIICRLEFKGRRDDVMRPGAYTRLFFLDEAVALAAGHRPCAFCRRDAYEAFVAAWRDGNARSIRPHAGAIDRQLHHERVEPRTRRQITHLVPIDDLPDGTFLTLPGEPDRALLLLDARLLLWTLDGYRPGRSRPSGIEVRTLTPRSIVAALREGFRPELHPSTAP